MLKQLVSQREVKSYVFQFIQLLHMKMGSAANNIYHYTFYCYFYFGCYFRAFLLNIAIRTIKILAT